MHVPHRLKSKTEQAGKEAQKSNFGEKRQFWVFWAYLIAKGFFMRNSTFVARGVTYHVSMRALGGRVGDIARVIWESLKWR